MNGTKGTVFGQNVRYLASSFDSRILANAPVVIDNFGKKFTLQCYTMTIYLGTIEVVASTKFTHWMTRNQHCTLSLSFPPSRIIDYTLHLRNPITSSATETIGYLKECNPKSYWFTQSKYLCVCLLKAPWHISRAWRQILYRPIISNLQHSVNNEEFT